MKSFTIHDAIRVSGLTRGQIDQAASRWGISFTYGSAARGTARRFSQHDLFRLTMFGRLDEAGLGWDDIRLIDACLPAVRQDASGEPLEMFQFDRPESADVHLIVAWVSRIANGELEMDAKIMTPETASAFMQYSGSKYRSILVLNATEIAASIRAAIEGSHD